jgi:hypothetical protein
MNKGTLVRVKKSGIVAIILDVETCKVIGKEYKIYYKNNYWWKTESELEVVDV